jgi:hypothetical protein
MILLELLDSSVKYTVTNQDADYYAETATINGRVIQFEAEQEFNPHDRHDDELTWGIAFIEMTDDPVELVPFTVKKTGSGGELKVFAFVKSALERFIKKYEPANFWFSADSDEPSRIKLYTAFIQRFNIPGYRVKETKDGALGREWTFVKDRS